jgi:hypothetical protein
MQSFEFRKKLLISLLSIAVLLVAVKIFLQQNSVFSASDNSVNESEIRKQFISILKDFSIDEKLVKEKRIEDKLSGNEISSFRIQVPKDLSIPEVLAEVYETFLKDSLKIISTEKVRGGKTILSIKDGKSAVLQCELDYSKNYSRNKGYISIMIEEVDPVNESALQILESTEKINFLLLPSSVNLKRIETIQKYGQQFSVLINDNIGEQKYELDPAHSEIRIETVIKTLVTDFQQAVCFIIDDNSTFYRSSNFEIFKKELTKRKIKLFATSEFIKLTSDERLHSDFINEIEAINPGGSKIFLMNEESYLSVIPEVKKLKKQGYRFIASSLILQD